MTYYTEADLQAIIDSFTVPQTLHFFNEMLDKYLRMPYLDLLGGITRHLEKCEEYKEHQQEISGERFNHRMETLYLIYMYAYSGAIEMLDPLRLKSRNEVTLSFIEAYEEMRKARNKANRDYNAKKRGQIVIEFWNPDILANLRVELETCQPEDQDIPDYETHFEGIQLDQYLEALRSLTIGERQVFDALAANPHMTHSEIAKKKLHKDPAQLSRALQRIRAKFASFAKS